MSIKDLFTQKENVPETYWSLVVEPGFVHAGIWYISDQKTEVLDVSPVTLWEEDEELVGAVDAALSSCAQKLPENFVEPTKTVFGVASSWVSEGEIKEEFLEKIKKICSELSITPAGFVVLPEAISHYYKFIEGVPLNAVIVGLREHELEISVFKTGSLIGTTQVARSVSIIEDCLEGLTRFGGADPLPSRIIVYNGKGGELEEAKDTLSGYTWAGNDNFNFLHVPKVELMESEKKVAAVAFAGATEIGGVSKIRIKSEENEEAKEDKEVKDLSTEIEDEVQPLKQTQPMGQMGFVVSKVEAPIQKTIEQPSRPVPARDYFRGVRNYLSSLPGKLKGKSITFVIIIIFILVGLGAFWWLYPKANVTIYVSPKSFEEQFEIVFKPTDFVTANVSGEKTKNTSGIKLIGERAKGSVQIRNGTSLPIDLSSGTVMLSSGDLRYSLDDSASVTAALSPGAPGTTTAQLTAGDIGAEYNLAKDEILKIGNYPKAEVDAVATADFSGGSSREILAVSEEDREKLKDELVNELIEKAKSDMSAKSSAEQLFINDIVSYDETDESFSHKVGDEADNLKLILGLEVKGIITDKAKLAQTVREKIADKTPQGFVLRDTQISYTFVFKEENPDGDIVFDLTAKVNFLPEINEDEIKTKTLGRLPEIVKGYLMSVPGFSRAEITLNPKFPGRFGTLPRVKKNITIEVVGER